jgi:2',3'-cyclic-nucleotide 2'-phosphodiesterase/3'-nucleotidase
MLAANAAQPHVERRHGRGRRPVTLRQARQPRRHTRGAGIQARLRILATSDLHFHLLPFDYYADRPLPGTGLAAAARTIAALRRGPWVTLLVDNGDLIQGNMMSDWLAAGGWSGPHPMIAAMNAIGYDAGTLGNHEFNHGLGHLRAALAEARFPIVSANIAALDAPLAPPWTILERDVAAGAGAPPLRIGVIGFAPPQIAAWDRARLNGALRVRDIVAAAEDELPRLCAAGADVVLALCHSGIGPEAATPGMENAAVPLAAVPGIDALVAGHTHILFPGPGAAAGRAVDPAAGRLHGKPAVQPGFRGSHVGVIDLALGFEAGRWRLRGSAARLERVGKGAPEAVVAALAAPAHARLRAEAARPVGTAEVPIHSHFALVAPSPALDIVADAKRAHARALLAETPEARLPVVVAVAPFRAGGRGGPDNYIDIPPGPVALRQAAELYIHPNSVVLLEIDGAGLSDWLERSASLFRRLVPGAAGQPLIDPGFPSYNFDVLDGLSYVIDPSQPPRTDPEGRILDPAARRVSDIRHEGRQVGPTDRFVLATNSYRLGSGGIFAAAAAARPIAAGPGTTRELVVEHVRTAPLRPGPRPRWRFAALPGTAAWFDSAPAALGHLGSVEGRDIRPLGPAAGGFWRFELRL